jgi:hypothetical protein
MIATAYSSEEHVMDKAMAKQRESYNIMEFKLDRINLQTNARIQGDEAPVFIYSTIAEQYCQKEQHDTRRILSERKKLFLKHDEATYETKY